MCFCPFSILASSTGLAQIVNLSFVLGQYLGTKKDISEIAACNHLIQPFFPGWPEDIASLTRNNFSVTWEKLQSV